MKNQKIYEITLTIICLNEFYYDLKVTPKEELKNKWQKITIFKRKGIEKLMNNVVTCDKYQNYLEEWIANEEKRCKN